MDLRMIDFPSGETTTACRFTPSAMRAYAPMGTWQPPPSAARTARSAVTAIRVLASSRRRQICHAAPLSSRVSMVRAPWPTAGHMTSGSSNSVIRSCQPRRRRPAEARRMASYWPSSSFRRRVSTLPRIFSMCRSGRIARNCAARRSELVPTRVASDRRLPTTASRGSSRTGVAASVSPLGISVGMSFRLWTARSIVPFSSASSISLVNKPLVPTFDSATSVILSPVVWMISMRHSAPSCSRRPLTQLACQSASCEPRDPTTKLLLTEPEHLSHGGNEVNAFGQRRMTAQFRDGGVSDLVDDSFCQRVDGVLLLLGESSELAAHAGDLGRANAFELFLDADDGGHDIARLETREHALHLFRDNLLGLLGFVLARVEIVLDDVLQVVDVVQENVVELVDLGVDVAGDCDVDDKDRLVFASLNHLRHIGARQDVVRRAAGGDDDIHLRHEAEELVVFDDFAIEQRRHFNRALIRAICHVHVRRAAALQVPGGGFRHLAGAHNQDLFVFKRAENLAREFDGREAYGNRARSDLGLGPDALGNVKGTRQKRVHEAVDCPFLLRDGVGGFELAENLRLAHHHRIEAGGDTEEVCDGVAVGEGVEVRPHPLALYAARAGQESVDHALVVRLVVGAGDRDLHAIAGGEDHSFDNAGTATEVFQGVRYGPFFKREAFAYLYRCTAMI